MILVLDTKSNRVIFYTSDLSQNLVLTNNSVIYRYTGIWPSQITLENCWDWMLVESELVHAATYNNRNGLSILEINRKEYIKNVNRKSNSVIDNYKKLDLIKLIIEELDNNNQGGDLIKSISEGTGESLENTILYFKDQFDSYKSLLSFVEFTRHRYIRALQLCRSNSELSYIYNKFNININNRSLPTALIEIIEENINTEDIKNEILALSDELWSIEQIDSRQESNIIELIKVIPTEFLEYPEKIWNSLYYEDTPLLDQLPALTTFLKNFAKVKSAKLARIMITKMDINEEVEWAVDIGEYYKNKKRYHLCLDGTYNISVLDKSYIMNPGSLIYVDNKLPNMRQQFGNTPRISIIFDLE